MKTFYHILIIVFLFVPFTKPADLATDNPTDTVKASSANDIKLAEFDQKALDLMLGHIGLGTLGADETAEFASDFIKDLSELIIERKQFIRESQKNTSLITDLLELTDKTFSTKKIKQYMMSLDDSKKTQLAWAMTTCSSASISYILAHMLFPDNIDCIESYMTTNPVIAPVIAASMTVTFKFLSQIRKDTEYLQDQIGQLQTLGKFISFKTTKQTTQLFTGKPALAITAKPQSPKSYRTALRQFILKYFKLSNLRLNIQKVKSKEMPIYKAILQSMNTENFTNTLQIDNPEERQQALAILDNLPTLVEHIQDQPIGSAVKIAFPNAVHGVNMGAGAAMGMWLMGHLLLNDVIMEFVKTDNYAGIALTMTIICGLYKCCQKLKTTDKSNDSIQKALSPVLWLIAELAIYCQESNSQELIN